MSGIMWRFWEGLILWADAISLPSVDKALGWSTTVGKSDLSTDQFNAVNKDTVNVFPNPLDLSAV